MERIVPIAPSYHQLLSNVRNTYIYVIKLKYWSIRLGKAGSISEGLSGEDE
jgi:hypothetical protein